MITDIELATTLRTSISRLVKVIRRQTRNMEQLSMTERSTLAVLDLNPGLLPTELAAMERVTTQSMSQVVNHLSKLGFILRTPSPEDGRKVLLSLTLQGRQYLEKARQEKQEWLARTIHERLSAKEKETLMEAMAILTRLIDE
jgi:DNA-binding MarR family transcriptional regulator